MKIISQQEELNIIQKMYNNHINQATKKLESLQYLQDQDLIPKK